MSILQVLIGLRLDILNNYPRLPKESDTKSENEIAYHSMLYDIQSRLAELMLYLDEVMEGETFPERYCDCDPVKKTKLDFLSKASKVLSLVCVTKVNVNKTTVVFPPDIENKIRDLLFNCYLLENKIKDEGVSEQLAKDALAALNQGLRNHQSYRHYKTGIVSNFSPGLAPPQIMVTIECDSLQQQTQFSAQIRQQKQRLDTSYKPPTTAPFIAISPKLDEIRPTWKAEFLATANEALRKAANSELYLKLVACVQNMLTKNKNVKRILDPIGEKNFELALRRSADEGNVEWLKLLLDYFVEDKININLNSISESNGRTAFHYAALHGLKKEGSLEPLKLLEEFSRNTGIQYANVQDKSNRGYLEYLGDKRQEYEAYLSDLYEVSQEVISSGTVSSL